MNDVATRALSTRTGAGVYLIAMFGVSAFAQFATSPPEPTGPDIYAYGRIAGDILSNANYWSNPEAFDGNFWAMAYPSVMAQVMRVTGGNLEPLRFIQILLVSSLVLVPWLLLRRLGIWFAVAATTLLVVNPSFWSLGPSIGYEAMLAWLLSYVLVAAWMVRTGHASSQVWQVGLAFLAGLGMALATLTQTKSIAVVPVVAYLLWKGSRSLALCGGVGAAIGILPWMVRNLLVVGSPSPLTHNGPYNLWVGNNPESLNGGSMVVAPIPPGGSSLTSAALDFIVSQPEKWLDLTFVKAVRLFEPVFVYPEQLGALRSALHMWTGAIALVVATGVLFYWGAMLLCSQPRIPAVRSFAVFVALFYASHLPFIAEPRFMTSVLPISTSVAAAYWVWVAARVRRRTWVTRPTSGKSQT